MRNNENIVLFDGVCNLCNSLVQFIIRRDPEVKFTFASLQSVSGKTLLEKYELQTDFIDSIVYIKTDICYQKSTAVLHILKDLGGVWKLCFIFIIIPKFIRDFIYQIISKRRYKLFGKLDSCMLPTPDIEERFLK